MQIGAIIEKGPMDWQVIQQMNGQAVISLSGSWTAKDNAVAPRVFARIVNEETGETVIPWKKSDDEGNGKWKMTIANVPAGGLYRLETVFYFRRQAGFNSGCRQVKCTKTQSRPSSFPCILGPWF